MQAIVTKYIPATNTKPSRIKAECRRGKLIVSYNYDLDDVDNHREAAKALQAKFNAEDMANYGSTIFWDCPTVAGELPDGSYCHVLVDRK